MMSRKPVHRGNMMEPDGSCLSPLQRAPLDLDMLLYLQGNGHLGRVAAADDGGGGGAAPKPERAAGGHL